MKHVVKRKGHTEPYEQRKLYASIYAICLAVREPMPSAEMIAAKVSEHVETWLEDKGEVTSHDIRLVAAKHLATYHPDAAYLYENHRNLA